MEEVEEESMERLVGTKLGNNSDPRLECLVLPWREPRVEGVKEEY